MKSGPRRVLLLAGLACMPMVAACADGSSSQQPQVRDAWARATPPGVDAAAVYLTVGGGARADRLTGISTSRASMAQLHAVTTDGAVTRMRETDSVDIPARTTVTFVPQGMHVMLMGLASPLTAGERFTLSLQFATSGKREVSVVVVPATATGPEPR
jgi:copper(I)-binding protein